ncbi:hypothetical protein ILUMI_23063 [Ignelater luminosus]|uniref:Exonuclease domain-containing protein n=1 Tax=Ignelater luminosus TaxID=2038154 RepID=A0A8K0G296_IGNLU|nr:hypothetical protein ILUMI_23063 [Ignelater luminosus]
MWKKKAKPKNQTRTVPVEGRHEAEKDCMKKVQRASLFRYCHKEDPHNTLKKKKLGRKPVLPEDLENQLVEYLLLVMEGKFVGLIRREVRFIAFQLARRNNISNPFNSLSDCLQRVLKRLKDKLRICKSTGTAREAEFNRKHINDFFTLLQEVLQKNNYAPNKIFNVDKTGQSKCPEVIAKRGKRQIGQLTSAERGSLVTAILITSSSNKDDLETSLNISQQKKTAVTRKVFDKTGPGKIDIKQSKDTLLIKKKKESALLVRLQMRQKTMFLSDFSDKNTEVTEENPDQDACFVVVFVSKTKAERKCSLGHPKSDHDCRLNFIGSAKAMEPFAAACMTSNSTIFKDLNMEVGILIGDDDSSTIAAVRAATKSQVIKLSDKNHTSRGVTNTIYKHANEHKELKNDSIAYLHRCFTYAISRNAGNCTEIANSLRNIPNHTFNNHSNCADWCRYAKNPTTYEHRVIKGGFQSPKLFEDLKTIFDKLADNVERFAAGASSQANESLNATMATAKKRLLSPSVHTTKYIDRRSKLAKRRYLNVKRPEFKRRRLFLKEQRANLRKKKEDMEGTQYESNMGLLSTNVAHDSIFNTDGVNEEIIETDDGISPSDSLEVFFDLETSSFSKHSDILQIAAQGNKSTFSVYINPIQKIAPQASEANGLTNVKGELMFNGTRVPSIPLRLALDAFRNFLRKLKHPVVLVAHNCKFDAPILINSVKKMSMVDEFGSVVVGFADTLPLIKSVTNREGKGECTLTGLAAWLNISADGVHNAVYDVLTLVKIVEHLKITDEQIINRKITWDHYIASVQNAEKSAKILKTLIPLGNCMSAGMEKKLAEADISYNDLISIYLPEQPDIIPGLEVQ